MAKEMLISQFKARCIAELKRVQQTGQAREPHFADGKMRRLPRYDRQRDSMRARQNMEFYCEEFLSKRAKPPDKSGRTTGITLQGGNKQAI